jgi:myo-inositol-hexaphosphate 3-phosphohydrolase
VEPGLSKYPTVDFTENYNIPIKDIDIRLAQDEETQAVVIGEGYWSKCWKRMEGITTKTQCYEYARDTEKVYGFAFSDQTNICLVYSGIKDNTKIKLDRYNSESRLSLFDPCDEDASWFT